MINIENNATFVSSSSICSDGQFTKYISPISYNFFFENHLRKNVPCIFSNWLSENWIARQEWVDNLGQPNINKFNENFGDAEVPLADCSSKVFDSHEKRSDILKNYLGYFKNVMDMQEPSSSSCLYLKDWHFWRTFPSYEAYTTPEYFASDWLNEFWEHREDPSDDYRFVYIGPKGSWTPFHADVFRSYSWSSNICGRKRWIFYPPGQEVFLKDKFGNLIYDIDDIENESLYPQAKLASQRIEVIQEAGETIFVPSNWFHQVWNEVESSISDCIGMDGFAKQCQLILKSTHGMDVEEFLCFIKVIAERRLKAIKEGSSVSSIDNWTLGKEHIEYDISRLHWCLESLLDKVQPEILESLEDVSPNLLLEQLSECL